MCRQYSHGTMEVRKFTQHVLIGFTIGIAIFLAKIPESDSVVSEIIWELMIAGGCVAGLFAIVLWLLNYHYSHAFREIRNRTLIPLEKQYFQAMISNSGLGVRKSIEGPWEAHCKGRQDRAFVTFLAWFLPSIALMAVGCASATYGLYNLNWKLFGMTSWPIPPSLLLILIGFNTYFGYFRSVDRLKSFKNSLGNMTGDYSGKTSSDDENTVIGT